MSRKCFLFIFLVFCFNYLNAGELVSIKDVKMEENHLINFTAMNLRFQGLTSSQGTAQYTEDMQLELLEQNVLETDSWGRYRIQATFLNPYTGERIHPISKWAGGDKFIQRITKHGNRFGWSRGIYKPQPGTAPGYGMGDVAHRLESWNVDITLEDGTTFSFAYPDDPGKFHSATHPAGGFPYKDDGKATDLFKVGDEMEMVSEWSGDDNMRKNYQSHYRLKHVQKGIEVDATGTTHYLVR